MSYHNIRRIVITTSYKKRESLAVFDLDNTLLNGDSDYTWTKFLIAKGYLDGPSFLEENARFHEDYQHGCLDIHKYIAFIGKPIQAFWPDRLADIQAEYFLHIQTELLQPEATHIINQHKKLGHYTMIMTATNNIIVEPICEYLHIDSWMATMLEINGDGFTGKIAGTPCFQDGKKTLLTKWITERPQFSLDDCYFYSDSHNDLPLLQSVSRPVAVDPDDQLHQHAQQNNWPVITLRQHNQQEIPYATVKAI